MVKTSLKVLDGSTREKQFFGWSEHKESHNLVKN